MIIINNLYWYASSKYDIFRILINSDDVLFIGRGYKPSVLLIGIENRDHVPELIQNIVDVLVNYYGYDVRIHSRIWYYRSPYHDNKNKLLIHNKLVADGRKSFTSIDVHRDRAILLRLQRSLDQSDPRLQIEHYWSNGEFIR